MFICKRKDGIKWQYRRLGLNFRVLSKNCKWDYNKVSQWFLFTAFGYVVSFRIKFIYWVRPSGLTQKTIDSIDECVKNIHRLKGDSND